MNFYFYYTGVMGLCLISGLALFEKLGNKRNLLFFSDTFYLIAISIFLIINRLAFFNSGMLNIDESVMLSAGRTFGQDPRPWISVDPSTSGPINLLPAVLLIKLLDSASYGELRLLYIVAFQIPTLIILFLTARKVTGPFKARLAIIPLTLCFAFLFYFDHVHASSEQIPVLFTAIGISTIIGIAFNKIKRWQLIVTGVTCALGPFAKLQVGPLLFFICFACCVLLIDKKRWKDAASLIVGFGITSVAIFLIIYLNHAFPDFLQSYIRSNLRYATTQYPREMMEMFINYNITGLLPLLMFVTFILFWTAKGIKFIPKEDYRYPGVLALVVLVAAYCIIKPGRFYPHYGLLLIIPLYSCFLWVGLRSSKFDAKLIPYFLAGIGVLLLANIYKTSRAFNGWELSKVEYPEILDVLIAEGKQNDRLAVWGWGSPYIHGAKLLMGTRDVHFDFQTSYHGSVGDYYTNRFLSDLNKNRPKWFLDISGPTEFGGSQKNQLENFSKINDFVRKNYEITYKEGSGTLYRYKGK